MKRLNISKWLPLCIILSLALSGVMCNTDKELVHPLAHLTMLERFNGRFIGDLRGSEYGSHERYVVDVAVQNDTLAYISSIHWDSIPVIFYVENDFVLGEHLKNAFPFWYDDYQLRLTISKPNFVLDYYGRRRF